MSGKYMLPTDLFVQPVEGFVHPATFSTIHNLFVAILNVYARG
jgi:hypothetical protein